VMNMPTVRASREAFTKLVMEAKSLKVSVTDLLDMYVLVEDEESEDEEEDEDEEDDDEE